MMERDVSRRKILLMVVFIAIPIFFLLLIREDLYFLQTYTDFVSWVSGTSSNEQIHRIYYFSTQEGLVSHLIQLQILWYVSLPYHNGTKFIVVPWHTPYHFPGVHSVSLCDYFLLPEQFSCEEKRPFDEVARSLPSSTVCELKNATFATDPGYYKLKRNQVKVVDEFHFRETSCVGGFLALYNSDKIFLKEVIMPWQFHPKYIQQMNCLKQKTGLLPADSNDYVVVHWRRGDQLTATVRCQPSHVNWTPIDTSVNCGSVEPTVTCQLDSDRYFCELWIGGFVYRNGTRASP
jgi:hypothetical protein